MNPAVGPCRIELIGVRYRPRWASSLGTWDVRAASGEVWHLHAPNGAGKSTWMQAAVGLVPASWERRHLGPIAAPTLRAVRYAPSGPALPAGMRLGDAVTVLARRYGLPRRTPLVELARWGLRDLLDVHVGDLSHGQQRAALLAAVLAPGPAAVLLDEPTVALDEGRRSVLLEVVRNHRTSGSAVVVADHEPLFWEPLVPVVVGDG